MTFNGLSLGDGSDYLITNIDGWEDRPETTNGSTPHPRRLGSWVGGLSSVKRVVTVDLKILATRQDNLTTIPKSLLTRALAMNDEESPLVLDLGYGIPTEQIFARVTAFDMPTVRGYGREQPALVEFTATDPRRYSIQVNSAQTGLPVALRGNAYPIAYGRYAEQITPENRGEAVVQNIGNSPATATYRIVGPVKNPTITVNGPKGFRRRIQFNVNLASGEVLYAQSAYGSVEVGGSARRGITTGALMEDMEVPSGTSTVALGGAGSTNAKLTVSWRDANL